MRCRRMWAGLRSGMSRSILAAAALVVLTSAPAEAWRGVKYVHFDPAQTLCLEDQAMPCKPYQGFGNSNELEVHMSPVGDSWVFDTLHVPGVPQGFLWAAASYSGKCRAGYDLNVKEVRLGHVGTIRHRDYTIEYTGDWQGWPVHREDDDDYVAPHVIDMWVPLEFVFPGDGEHLFGFPTAQSIFDWGENVIADRIASGMTEEEARSEPFEVNTFLGMNGYLTCKGNSFGRVFGMQASDWLPLKLKFVPPPIFSEIEQPQRPEPGSQDLKVDAAVVQAHLSVLLDPQDSCRLALSGVVVTNEATEVRYRIVDEVGVKSQIFTTQVDPTFTVFLDHYVELPIVYPQVEGTGGNGTLVAEDDGEIGGLVQESSDNVQGTYMIEILQPHAYESNIAGYNVEPCMGLRDPETGLVRDPALIGLPSPERGVLNPGPAGPRPMQTPGKPTGR